MPTSDQPWAAYHFDSARVENRGPSMTTIVPPSTTSGSAARSVLADRPQYGSAKETWRAPSS